MKKLEMLFYPVNPSEKNTGLKFVLFEITTDTSEIIYDWGFCNWNGLSWDPVETPENFTCVVKWWSNTLNPDVLMKEISKIIKI